MNAVDIALLDERIAIEVDGPLHFCRNEQRLMASRRDELLAGGSGTISAPAPVFGEQMWNYYVRSYPNVVRLHYPDLV